MDVVEFINHLKELGYKVFAPHLSVTIFNEEGMKVAVFDLVSGGFVVYQDYYKLSKENQNDIFNLLMNFGNYYQNSERRMWLSKIFKGSGLK